MGLLGRKGGERSAVMVDAQQSTAHKEQRDRQEQHLTAQATINKSTAAETGQTMVNSSRDATTNKTTAAETQQPTRQQQQQHDNQQG